MNSNFKYKIKPNKTHSTIERKLFSKQNPSLNTNQILLSNKLNASIYRQASLFQIRNKIIVSINTKLNLKYNSKKNTWNIRIIDDIIYNEKSHIVSVFKDYLIYDDNSEFMKRYYYSHESRPRLPKIIEYYINNTRMDPNYSIINGSRIVMKGIKKKEKLAEAGKDIKNERDESKKKDKHEKLFTDQLKQSIDKINPLYSTSYISFLSQSRFNYDEESIFNTHNKNNKYINTNYGKINKRKEIEIVHDMSATSLYSIYDSLKGVLKNEGKIESTNYNINLNINFNSITDSSKENTFKKAFQSITKSKINTSTSKANISNIKKIIEVNTLKRITKDNTLRPLVSSSKTKFRTISNGRTKTENDNIVETNKNKLTISNLTSKISIINKINNHQTIPTNNKIPKNNLQQNNIIQNIISISKSNKSLQQNPISNQSNPSKFKTIDHSGDTPEKKPIKKDYQFIINNTKHKLQLNLPSAIKNLNSLPAEFTSIKNIKENKNNIPKKQSQGLRIKDVLEIGQTSQNSQNYENIYLNTENNQKNFPNKPHNYKLKLDLNTISNYKLEDNPSKRMYSTVRTEIKEKISKLKIKADTPKESKNIFSDVIFMKKKIFTKGIINNK